MFRAEVLTLFPEIVQAYVSASILGKARERGLVEIGVTNIRDFAEGRHRVVDDAPYGGGAGMVMKVDPVVAAIEAARGRLPGALVLLMSPRGETLDQPKVRELAKHAPGLVLVCGRYEGIDERVASHVDEEISLGDYVLTGGELAALAIVDAVARHTPSVLGNEASAGSESFEDGLLEYPQYTRPAEFREQRVPEILQSGDHARIARWRRWQGLRLTQDRRPDLFKKLVLSDADRKLLETDEASL